MQLQLHYTNYTTLITLHHNYNSTTLQLQQQLHYTTLHPAVVGEVTDPVTTATISAPKRSMGKTDEKLRFYTQNVVNVFVCKRVCV